MLDGGEAIRKLALNVARFSGLAPLMRPLVGGLGAILMLHRVSASPNPLSTINRHLTIAPAFLDAVITDMKRLGYEFVTLDEALDRLVAPSRDRPFAAITADDGYRDNLVEALPVLDRHGAPITIFVAPALIDGTALLWWDVVEQIVASARSVVVDHAGERTVLDCASPVARFQANAFLHDLLQKRMPEQQQFGFLERLADRHGVDPQAISRTSLMDWAELARIAGHPLVTLGAHTVNHYNLRRLDPDVAYAEIRNSRDIIADRVGRRPRHFAYPYGYRDAVGSREVALVRDAGFSCALTTRHGVLRAEHSGFLHALPRISLNGRYQRVAHIRTMLSGVTTPLANAGRMVVTV